MGGAVRSERFLCDAMLGRLARWLRAAGYDAALAAPQLADGAILRRAREEARLLLTCDRRLAEEDATAMRLPMADIDTQAVWLRDHCGVDWLRAPFTRCLVDNARLERLPSPPGHAIPEPARTGAGPFTRCPACGRHYWPGSHLRRMRRRLERWAAKRDRRQSVGEG